MQMVQVGDLKMEPAIEVSAGLQGLYADYYSDASQTVWREACARDKARHIEALCRDLDPVSVLEVGCGEGAVLAELASIGLGRELHGVEISQSGVEATRARAIPRLSSIDVFNGYQLNFADQSIDLVYATHVLEHVEHERLFLQELARVGRHVFIEVPLENTLRVAGAIRNKVGHINFYNRHTLTGMMQSVGLTVERLAVYDHPWEIHAFRGSRLKALAKMALRRTAIIGGSRLGEGIFVYHAAVLCRGARIG
jgi:ubiquinone/menaquinone biosynthesis C-methylase UbiE